MTCRDTTERTEALIRRMLASQTKHLWAEYRNSRRHRRPNKARRRLRQIRAMLRKVMEDTSGPKPRGMR